jgi:glycosyltransferase involved in cell wall biosynthesis
MRICQFSPEYFPMIGGGATVVHRLAQAISKIGCEVAILAPGERADGASYRFDSLARLDEGRTYEKVLLKNLDMEKRRFDFNILHAHFAWPTGYAAALWGKTNDVPTVITCHGIDLNTDRRLNYGYRLRGDLSRKIKAALEKAKAVVCVSRFLAGRAVEAGCPKDKLYIIPNGVVLDELSRNKSESRTESYILFLGNLRRVKGVDLLLSAFGRVVRDLADIKLYMAGDGEEKESLVKSCLKKPSLSGRVRFLKRVTGQAWAESGNWSSMEKTVC